MDTGTQTIILAAVVISAAGVGLYISLIAFEYFRRSGLRRLEIIYQLYHMIKSGNVEELQQNQEILTEVLHHFHSIDERRLAHLVREVISKDDEDSDESADDDWTDDPLNTVVRHQANPAATTPAP
jgi:hypothetical protein